MSKKNNEEKEVTVEEVKQEIDEATSSEEPETKPTETKEVAVAATEEKVHWYNKPFTAKDVGKKLLGIGAIAGVAVGAFAFGKHKGYGEGFYDANELLEVDDDDYIDVDSTEVDDDNFNSECDI